MLCQHCYYAQIMLDHVVYIHLHGMRLMASSQSEGGADSNEEIPNST